jgi:predicted phosphodiesterase
MKYLILSDIHGNLEALQSVLQKVKDIKIDKYVCLGDLVGYGASPNEVVERVREMEPLVTIRGNHDRVSAGLSDGHDFNYAARDAALWTRRTLSAENKTYVADLTQGPVVVDDLFAICHGSPQDEDYYIFQWTQALPVLRRLDKQIAFFGHTHIPVIWSLNGDDLSGESPPGEPDQYSLAEDSIYLINPGSVGQPRDRNPKASVAVFDADEMKMQFFRVEYKIEAAQQKIVRAGLDGFLADRLAVGR